MRHHTVKELMKENPVFIDSDSTLAEAAQMMAQIQCGVLPVGTQSAFEGMITDRDIVIRAVAKGLDPALERVRDYMTPKVWLCKEDDTLDVAADLMCKHQVSRLAVKNKQGQLCGILTFGAILRKDNNVREVNECVQHATGKVAA